MFFRNNSAKISPILGFKFNTEKVSNQISAVNTVLQEFEKYLYTGSVDPIRGLDDLNKKLESSGIGEIKKDASSIKYLEKE
ncbi:DUF3502 domain-containing protein [Clostridium perfringens]|uniref:DUF3502 domain-containing protein n=2 Tax=Clostridium perfringens TaxID=1502 RepID=UPI00099224E5|nr:DUF3502 domain-containing protein [Clostridium perfringens]